MDTHIGYGLCSTCLNLNYVDFLRFRFLDTFQLTLFLQILVVQSILAPYGMKVVLGLNTLNLELVNAKAKQSCNCLPLYHII